MDISIIIVNWNAASYLEKCLRSINENTHKLTCEIIVVDNASTDGSVELVKNRFPQVKLICNETNLGFAKANNIGINQSNGKYICLINSDVEVTEVCLENMIAYMERHHEVGILGPQIIGSRGDIQRSCMGFPTLWNTFCRALSLDTLFPKSKTFGSYMMTYQDYGLIQQVDIINGCFWMVRRDALRQVGLLDERFFIYAEDKDWCKRFWKVGWKVVYFPEAKAIHYGGASSANAPIRFYIEMQKANIQYWEKHYGQPAKIIYLFVTIMHHMIRIIGEFILYFLSPGNRINTIFNIRRSSAIIKWLLGYKESYGT